MASHDKILTNFDEANLETLNHLLDELFEHINFSNIDNPRIEFTSSATPNAENTVAHNLGRIPLGYFVVCQDKAGSLYKGATAWTKDNIYLKCDIATVVFKIIVI